MGRNHRFCPLNYRTLSTRGGIRIHRTPRSERGDFSSLPTRVFFTFYTSTTLPHPHNSTPPLSPSPLRPLNKPTIQNIPNVLIIYQLNENPRLLFANWKRRRDFIAGLKHSGHIFRITWHEQTDVDTHTNTGHSVIDGRTGRPRTKGSHNRYTGVSLGHLALPALG